MFTEYSPRLDSTARCCTILYYCHSPHIFCEAITVSGSPTCTLDWQYLQSKTVKEKEREMVCVRERDSVSERETEK